MCILLCANTCVPRTRFYPLECVYMLYIPAFCFWRVTKLDIQDEGNKTKRKEESERTKISTCRRGRAVVVAISQGRGKG